MIRVPASLEVQQLLSPAGWADARSDGHRVGLASSCEDLGALKQETSVASINHRKPRGHSYHRNGQGGVAAFIVTMNGHLKNVGHQDLRQNYVTSFWFHFSS